MDCCLFSFEVGLLTRYNMIVGIERLLLVVGRRPIISTATTARRLHPIIGALSLTNEYLSGLVRWQFSCV